MKRNHRIMLIGIGLMLLALLICMGSNSYTWLRKPVFLSCCMEAPVGSNQSASMVVFKLQYITNSSDKRQVMNISFREVPEMYFFASESLPLEGLVSFYSNVNLPMGQKLGKYSLHTVYVYQNNFFREEWEGEKELNTAEIRFNDGSSMTTNIGRILLYSEAVTEGALDSKLYSNNNVMNEYRSVFQANKKLTILSLSSPYMKEVASFIDIKVDDKKLDKIAGTIYNQYDNIAVNIRSNTTDENGLNYDMYNIAPKLCYRDENGVNGYIRIHNIEWVRSFKTFKDTLNYLKEKGAI